MKLWIYLKENWLFGTMTMVGMMMVFLIPPFQKPDEVVHFLSAASMASGRYAMVESRFSAMPERFKALKIAHKYEYKFYEPNLFYKDENRSVQFHEFAPTVISHLSYLPSVLAIKIFDFIDYPTTIFYLARLTGLILFLALFGVAYKIIPKEYRYFLTIYGLLPMVMHQATEVSYDVMLLSLAPLLFALTLRILASEKSKSIEIVILIMVSILLVFVKPGYYALALCPMLVFWKMFKGFLMRNKWILVGIGIVGVMAVNIGLWVVLNKFDDKGYKKIAPSYQIAILKQDPGFGVKVLIDTWESKREFYAQSFLGYFGWLDYKYDLFEYCLVISLLAYLFASGVKEVKKPLLDGLGILMLAGVASITYVLIEFIFWLYWTTVGSSVVEGVQGRYFLVLVPFVLWFGTELYLKMRREKARFILLLMLVVLIGLNTYKDINKRYYDFSENFSNKNELAKNIEDSRAEELPLEKISSRDAMDRYFDTSYSDIIGGFQFAFDVNDQLIKVPFEYKITNEEGTKIFKKGYLNQDLLQQGGIYEHKVDAFKGGGVMRLVIKPVIVDKQENYFDYLSLYNEIQAKLLFVTKEQK